MIVALESLDSLGKSTQATLLKEKGFNVLKSPDYDSDLGKLIKKRLFSGDLDSKEMALLFLSDLMVMENKIKNNKVNILDRSYVSTVVYQDLDIKVPELLGFTKPDLVIYFEGKPFDDGKIKDYMERDEVQERVKVNYEKILNNFNTVKINANRDIRSVFEDIVCLINYFRKD